MIFEKNHVSMHDQRKVLMWRVNMRNTDTEACHLMIWIRSWCEDAYSPSRWHSRVSSVFNTLISDLRFHFKHPSPLRALKQTLLLSSSFVSLPLVFWSFWKEEKGPCGVENLLACLKFVFEPFLDHCKCSRSKRYVDRF